MKKKIFLGAYINHINAQNINCRSIATHLDKNKYSVKTLLLGNKSIEDLKEVSYINVSQSVFRLSNTFAFLRGVLWADICYFPKHHSTPKIALIFAKIFNKKIFTTIEGNMCDRSIKSMIDSFNGIDNMVSYFRFIPNIFGITKHLCSRSNCGVRIEKNPLYLGVEQSVFNNSNLKYTLNNIVFAGSIVERKRVHEILELAEIFDNIIFNIIGDGDLRISFENIASENVVFHGTLTHDELSTLFKDMDLNILLSKSEGFPKVILEAAASGIPSIVYCDYGASEWIATNKNGFVVTSFNDVTNKINQIINNPNLLQNNSEGALDLAKKFDWKNLIRNWEYEIDNLR